MPDDGSGSGALDCPQVSRSGDRSLRRPRNGTIRSVDVSAFEHDIPWTLVRVESNDQTVVLRYPTVLAPGVDVRLAPVAVDMDEKTVAITLTEKVRTEASSGLVGVYFDTRETTVILDEPLRGRAVAPGRVDADMDAYREALRSADREARSMRP